MVGISEVLRCTYLPLNHAHLPFLLLLFYHSNFGLYSSYNPPFHVVGDNNPVLFYSM